MVVYFTKVGKVQVDIPARDHYQAAIEGVNVTRLVVQVICKEVGNDASMMAVDAAPSVKLNFMPSIGIVKDTAAAMWAPQGG